MSVTLLLGAGNVALQRFRIAVDLLLAVCMLVQEMAKQCYLLRLDIEVEMCDLRYWFSDGCRTVLDPLRSNQSDFSLGRV